MSERTTLSADAVSGTTKGYVVDPGTGEKFEATFTDISEEQQRELQELENQTKDGDTEAAEELQTKIINDYCHNDIQYSDCGVAMRQAIMVGFLRALGDKNEAVSEAEEFFDAVEAQQGNA